MKKYNISIMLVAFVTAVALFGFMYFKYQSSDAIEPANKFSKVVTNMVFAAVRPQVAKASDVVISEIVNLSGQGLTFIPADLFKNTSLKELNLTNNSITSLPSQIKFWTNLEALRVGDNALTYLPAEIKYISNLTTLDASNNNLTFIPSEIGQLSKLKNLDLSNNQISDFPNELYNLIDLETLNIRGNLVTEENLKLLQDSLIDTKIIF